MWNFKKFTSGLAAMAVAATAFVAVPISAGAATDQVYLNEDYSSYNGATLIDKLGTNYTFGDIVYRANGREGSPAGTVALKNNDYIEIQVTRFSGSNRGATMTFASTAEIPSIDDLDNDAILKLSFDLKGGSGAFVVSGFGTLKLSELGVTGDAYSTVSIELNKYTGKQTVYVGEEKKSEAALTASTFTGFAFTDTTDTTKTANVYMYMDNIKVEQTTADTTAQTADYTVKFVDEHGTEIKESSTRNGNVNDSITLLPTDTANFTDGTKYIYVENDAAGKTIAADGTTVVTVTFRTAATCGYTVASSVGSYSATGTALEGNSVTVAYPEYIIADGTAYYKAPANNQYNYSFVVNNDNQVETLNYEPSKEDVVYFAEGEDVFTNNNVSNAGIRCSMGKGGDISETTNVTTLPAGKYKITSAVWGGGLVEGNNTTYSFKAGENEVYTIATTGSRTETTSEEFTLTKPTAIYVEKSVTGDRGACIDLVLIQKTGEIADVKTVTENDGSIATSFEASNISVTGSSKTIAWIIDIPVDAQMKLDDTGKAAFSGKFNENGENGIYTVTDSFRVGVLCSLPNITETNVSIGLIIDGLKGGSVAAVSSDLANTSGYAEAKYNGTGGLDENESDNDFAALMGIDYILTMMHSDDALAEITGDIASEDNANVTGINDEIDMTGENEIGDVVGEME